jgi:hypothetical protein
LTDGLRRGLASAPLDGRKDVSIMTSTVSKALRNLVFERDSYTCATCELPANDLHHLLSRSHGGRNVPENLISLCRSCHMMIHREVYLKPDEYDDLECRMYEYVCDYYAFDKNLRDIIHELETPETLDE